MISYLKCFEFEQVSYRSSRWKECCAQKDAKCLPKSGLQQKSVQRNQDALLFQT